MKVTQLSVTCVNFLIYVILILASLSQGQEILESGDHNDTDYFTLENIHPLLENLTFDHSALIESIKASLKYEANYTAYLADSGEPVIATVEVAIVCDKEFADKFNHDERKIQDYFTAWFWDVTMRFRTLPSSSISFRITSLTVIKSKDDQPFVENVRNSTTGKVSFDDVLPLFRSWVYERLDKLPSFDIAILITHTSLEWYGGQAAFGGACAIDKANKSHMGAVILDGTLAAGAHEIAHLLSAPHDENQRWCSVVQSGFIMDSSVTSGIPNFFSQCTDQYISRFLRSKSAACLRQFEPASQPPFLDPDFDSALPPTIFEQCQLLSSIPNAPVRMTEDGNKCGKLACRTSEKDAVVFTPIYNTKCGNGRRCFQGRCILPGALLLNVGSGKCLLGKRQEGNRKVAKMNGCPGSSTPFDRFTFVDKKEEGKWLVVPEQFDPFSSIDGVHFQDECLSFNYEKSYVGIHFEMCNSTLGQNLGWDLLDAGNDEFLLRHASTGLCAVAARNNDEVWLLHVCDKESPVFRWRFESVFPTPEMCPGEDQCEADLQATTFFKNISEAFTTMVVELSNREGVAVSPGATISWPPHLKLMEMPPNCIQLAEGENGTSVHCKLGRLLQRNKMAHLASLRFELLSEIQEYGDIESQLVIQVATTTASKTTQALGRVHEHTVLGIIIVFVALCVIIIILLIVRFYSSVRRGVNFV